MSDTAGDVLQYRLTGLRFPRHILTPEDEVLCGIELPDDHRRLVENVDDDKLSTVDEYLTKKADPVYQISDLCGNCRRVLLSECDEAYVHEAWNEWQEAVEALLNEPVAADGGEQDNVA